MTLQRLCDRCEEPAEEYSYRLLGEPDLCKKCFKAYKKWLKEGKK